MKYRIEFKPRALKDCRKISKFELAHIFEHIENMSGGLKGDVKRLTNFTPEYRLRVGDYRILFEIEEEQLTIYRIRHRKDVYK
ncbi:MAG: type II toxin-antitoxin system RelE/ParE family toxin [Nitrospina sp.]|jgi:mRNA interferase RelE/StbE|nr:type II toxin-antitoxin system RelE/ParE family toxin [Nitrospina sp.]